jgi:putative aminopeptidase FrvX
MVKATLKELCSYIPIKKVVNFCLEKLEKNGYNNIYKHPYNDYIFAEGDYPILLVAHMDTVSPYSYYTGDTLQMFYDSTKKVLWGVGGAGFDDRAGIYAILEIVSKTKRKPHILFTNQEEIGGYGAKSFCKDWDKDKLPPINYMIELDKSGKKFCVFYDCDNQQFIDFIKSKDFEVTEGTFSDISILAPFFNIAAVNLSIGYQYEHTACEILRMKWLTATIQKVINIINEDNTEVPYKYSLIDKQITKCTFCGNVITDENYYNIETKTNDFVGHICRKCFYGTRRLLSDIAI